MSSSRHRGSGQGGSSRGGSGSKKSKSSQQSIRQLIESLQTHRVNTLTELCRIERVAASCENAEDAQAFQEPMTSAWAYYVNSNQMLSELVGLTPDYPFCGDIISYAQALVRSDPESNRSWNLAWLVLTRIRDEGLVATYAMSEASRPEMWGSHEPTEEEVNQLAAYFQHAWDGAVNQMLNHWTVAPTWY
ncbi:hypothetical protein B0H63DRAFT_454007 [Podospora didyma]|uniref:Uncharacterized protein n=1 Tax=Podospora didyma TaxID=330526 RepID=A0AAE0N6L0_9PEZI|nr:hypothetical protein B0H63DRAFT_454007 [Podospora didyma]